MNSYIYLLNNKKTKANYSISTHRTIKRRSFDCRSTQIRILNYFNFFRRHICQYDVCIFCTYSTSHCFFLHLYYYFFSVIYERNDYNMKSKKLLSLILSTCLLSPAYQPLFISAEENKYPPAQPVVFQFRA